MLHVLRKKTGLEIEADQVKVTGMSRSNIINNYCLLYEVRLTPEQYELGQTKAKQIMRESERRFYPITVDQAAGSIERMYGGKRTIGAWDPNTYYTVLYALRAEGRRTPDQLRAIEAAGQRDLAEHPVAYEYAIEKYLKETE